jgi:ElaB/YqjD/DUF883 family membrane-anchored ribosome-binding protein
MLLSMNWKTLVVTTALVVSPFAASTWVDDGARAASLFSQSQPPQTQPPTQPPTEPPTQPPTQPPPTPPPTTQPPTEPQSGRDAALGHLSEARDSLAEMTKLPEAAKLQGQARTEVNALITNFNALISATGPEWKDHYQRVRQNVMTLLPASGTASSSQSAVGTSGSQAVQLEPAVEEKLKDVRRHLDLFAEAAGVEPVGGGTSTAGSSTATQDPPPPPPPATTGTAGAGTTNPAQAEIDRHIDALSQIVDRALSGTTGEAQVSLDRAELEQIRRHVQQLREAIRQKDQR